jgi:16S rRNA (cytidine1402-2'-O)-methyltransferase
VIGPPLEQPSANDAQLDALLAKALAFMPVKAASDLVAEATGISRRTLYRRALALTGQFSNASGEEREP